MPMTKIKLPGLIDVHVHMREPGATHKEDWESGTKAAIAGGFTMLLAMPNTNPSVTTAEALDQASNIASQKAYCDWGQFIGAGPQNAPEIAKIAKKSAGLKMYLDATFGDLKLDEMHLWAHHFEAWPKELPLAVHAEQKTMAAAILMAEMFDRSIHICHVSKKEEILLIRLAKEKGIRVTCEVAPHHLFLSEQDFSRLGFGRSEVRPRLAKGSDVDALWENMDVIDCFATDHAPHTLEEKDSESPPPGFPGLETALPLLLTAANQGRLTVETIIEKMHTNPLMIFNLPIQENTLIEIDTKEKWHFDAKKTFSKSGWSPFDGWEMTGRLKKVILRGEEIFKEGQIVSKPSSGQNIRD
ncbi:MAG: amidohydrolase family protein [Chloroflexi bacterium]|jgi:carbamoyl-phosphate synthase / aspartate carbamoyltransferase / dihydroorotase|nr:amidohydrolase family protein [Chloroflexota bacterium]MBT3669829.1 amidohydrolase family protein [Chloroflexota bacterium]MBT4683852.1 amidohydrolase family protein [Chloroflexota bacterium]MBT6358196.1 amidohydrolase family protein [Chloroflexota bacterium]MBT7218299.1 amidohydrolase family protein [Chloroflexota bacterium]